MSLMKSLTTDQLKKIHRTNKGCPSKLFRPLLAFIVNPKNSMSDRILAVRVVDRTDGEEKKTYTQADVRSLCAEPWVKQTLNGEI